MANALSKNGEPGIIVATDVYIWKLLRIHRGHFRAVTERRIRALVDAVLASVTPTSHRGRH